MLERLAKALRTKHKMEKRFSWRETAEEKVPEQPSDLMSIDYKVDGSVSSNDVLAAWPDTAAPETDENLLLQLTAALSPAVANPIGVGVDPNQGDGTTHPDVPSVALDPADEYR